MPSRQIIRREEAMERYFRYGLFSGSFILFVLLSMFFIASPVSATSATAPSSPITVPQGGIFLLRGSITFDQAATGYFMWGPVYWYNNGDPAENFTVENISVYWTDGTPMENVVWGDWDFPNGHEIAISDDGDGIARNGTFYVGIWLQAASRDGTPHRVDNQKIYFAMDEITLFEPTPAGFAAGPITVQVLAPSPPVGGIAFQPDKLALLAPYIILAALIAISAASVAVYWRRYRK
jgi:hypothetical protein